MKNAYARAGVDVEAGETAVEMMKKHVANASRPEVIGGLGGFAGLFDASKLAGYSHPVLATSTDGVGTKVAIAQAMGVYDTIGWDLIGMLVDDLVVVGAEPLFVTDYISCGKLIPEKISTIVSGIAQATHAAGAALIGGETAEHPGLMGEDDFDIAGATTGVVEKDAMLGPDRVKVGDKLVAMASSGLHSNGYSLVRAVFDGVSLDKEFDELGGTLGDELLTPTCVYALDVLALIEGVEVHAMSHVTGGGLASNLERVLPKGVGARVERGTWALPAIFELTKSYGKLSREDVEATLNVGVGMVAAVAAEQADQAVELLEGRGIESWICGEIVEGERVELVGDYKIS